MKFVIEIELPSLQEGRTAVSPRDNLSRVLRGVLAVVEDLSTHGRIKGGLHWIDGYRVVKSYIADNADQKEESHVDDPIKGA
jgi:hypothetical protein